MRRVGRKPLCLPRPKHAAGWCAALSVAADVPVSCTMRRFHGRSPSGAGSGPPHHEGDWRTGSAAGSSRTVRASRTRQFHVARGREGLCTVSHCHEMRKRHRALGGIATPGGPPMSVTRGARLVGDLRPEGRRVPSHRRRGAWTARRGAPKGSARAGCTHHRRRALGGRRPLSRQGSRHDGPEDGGGHGIAAGRRT